MDRCSAIEDNFRHNFLSRSQTHLNFINVAKFEELVFFRLLNIPYSRLCSLSLTELEATNKFSRYANHCSQIRISEFLTSQTLPDIIQRFQPLRSCSNSKSSHKH